MSWPFEVDEGGVLELCDEPALLFEVGGGVGLLFDGGVESVGGGGVDVVVVGALAAVVVGAAEDEPPALFCACWLLVT